MTNRNPIKQFFITFPKSGDETKERFKDMFSMKFPIEQCKVVQESHEDGSPHIHAYFKVKTRVTKARVLRFYKDAYPESYKRIDVQSVRSTRAALEYLSKEDQSPLQESIPRMTPFERYWTLYTQQCRISSSYEEALRCYNECVNIRFEMLPLAVRLHDMGILQSEHQYDCAHLHPSIFLLNMNEIRDDMMTILNMLKNEVSMISSTSEI